MIVIVGSFLAILGAILEVRFIIRRRDHRRSEELEELHKENRS